MTELRFPFWQKHILDAQRETDPKKVLEHVTAAESAIFQRSQELQNSPGGVEEQDAIESSVQELLKIKVEKLHYPPLQAR